MGVVTIRMEVRRDGGPSREVEFLVDSGATLSVLPWTVWRALGFGRSA
jgi:predicted aspartyl protease